MYWIIGVAVLGLLFWLAVLTIVILLCFKRRVPLLSNRYTAHSDDIKVDTGIKDDPPSHKGSIKEYAPTTFFQEVVEVKDPELNETPPSISEYDLTDTVTTKHFPEEQEPESVYESTQTHCIVILDEYEPLSPSPVPKYNEYDTQSAVMEFIEEQPEWQSMDIQLRIDPTGEQGPVITRKDHATETGSFSFMFCILNLR